MSKDDTNPGGNRRRFRLSLSTWIFISLGLGIGAGLFFGEGCRRIAFIGDGFIRLLQMTVLPYIVVSLVHSIGGLTYERAKQLAGRVGVLLVGLWILSLVLVFAIAQAFPHVETASFFSTSALSAPPPIDLLGLYIPTNPFDSLANQVIPAIVLFCIVTGVALIGIPGKEAVLKPLGLIATAISRVANAVAMLTPIGVFALAANASGTMSVEELERVQAYLIGYAAAALLLTFVIMPMLVSLFTPFRFRDILRETKGALVVGFTTANLFVTLPLLHKACRRLLEKHDVDQDNAMASVNVILPTVLCFPNVGKVLTLLFIPFAGWFVGSTMEPGEFVQFSFVGLVMFFGTATVALPFLLDWQQIPADLFELYIVTSVVVDRLSVLASAMHMMVLALLATAMTVGLARLRLRRFVVGSGTILASIVVAVVGTRLLLERTISSEYTKDRVITGMQLLLEPLPAVVHETVPERPDAPPPGVSRLEFIHSRGVLRVGYDPYNLPWSYINSRGELVGFDVEMAHHLAREMGVALEFIPVGRTGAEKIEAIANNQFDVLMSGVAATPDVFAVVRFSKPYLDVHGAIVVRDHLRRRFKSIQTINNQAGLRIGIPNSRYIKQKITALLPNAELVPLDDNLQFFQDSTLELDAAIMSAEGGSAWTLLFPSYTVVLLKPGLHVQPFAYPVAGEDEELADFLSHWIDVKQRDGTIDGIANHWLYGHVGTTSEPRWSIIRDVLHWVN